ncbi:unnamed protein product [Aureobasidium mustum]|uniref:Uncharacterized protein n=1 Tax=Aureobasidium mustum TaxID=2773714 RepID=A0A9N8K4K1_9PEZI|nr:unnamed protein product [Aureobasidium mustum]
MSNRTTLSGSTVDSVKPEEKSNTFEEATTVQTKRRPSFATRSSLESTATTLPSYSGVSDQPPAYSGSALPSSSAGKLKAQAHTSNASSSSGPNAAAVRAMFAPPDPRTDKMHTTRPKRVENYDEDPTYKGKLARMTGSTSKWNYFGHDIEQYGNPFKSLRRKK